MAIEDVWPTVDEGRTPIHRVVGETVEVYADVFADGSLGVRAAVRWRRAGTGEWHRVPMQPVGNDRWRAAFPVSDAGTYEYGVEGWTDPYRTWRMTFARRVEAGTVAPIDLREGAEILTEVARRIGSGPEARLLEAHAARLTALALKGREPSVPVADALEPEEIVARYPDPDSVAIHPTTLRVQVDPARAGHSAWYELFPRSASPEPGRPGTLRDVAARLAYVADLGFDVVYLPPIHPIGHAGRRGTNNNPDGKDAPGSPWAIGSAEGGHTAIHPGLGTLDDFRALVAEARARGLEVALDLAFQCSPDHPWVRAHPAWFHRLPDGTIRPAENPPKRYDDIYPIDFGTPDWRALWTALAEVVEFWVAEGVRWFRVDNPHTKPFEFWRWLIDRVRQEHPEVLFLAEAFTRPKVMLRLAKVGFTHSYTYFAWRTRREQLIAYFRELNEGVSAEVLRPHLWPNTPDILTEQFHAGQRAVFEQRLLLAATLSPHYGLYGPAFELLEHVPRGAGQEEYDRSEKYEVRHWSLDAPGSLAPEIRRINRLRRENEALLAGRNLVFHEVDNEQLIAYSRHTPDRSNVVLVVANLNPERAESGWTWLDLAALGVPEGGAFEVEDLYEGGRYRWSGPRNFVRLDPAVSPAHVFRVRPLGVGP